jgi:biopolymer transport protein ExbD
MRTHRKREWSSLTVNMVPLINVIFLITIFIVMMINFSEVILKKVNLPKADEAREVKEQIIRKILITVKSEDLIFLGNKRVSLDNLEHMLWQSVHDPQGSIVQLRGERILPMMWCKR